MKRNWSKPSSESASKPSNFDWQKLYNCLEKTLRLISEPQDDLASFSEAIISARRAENYLTQVYTRISRYLADLKSTIKLKRFSGSLDIRLAGDLALIEAEYDQAVIYHKCLDKALQNVKHAREDINRRIQIKNLQITLKET